MPFEALDRVFNPDLMLPGKGGKKIYRIPEGDAEFGLWCIRVVSLVQRASAGQLEEGEEMPQLRFEGAQETAMQRKALGPVYDELIADGYGVQVIGFFTQTVIIWHAMGREMAELYWAAGGDGEAFRLAAGRRLKAQGSAAAKDSSSTAAASSTRRRGSTSGTKSRKAS